MEKYTGNGNKTMVQVTSPNQATSLRNLQKGLNILFMADEVHTMPSMAIK